MAFRKEDIEQEFIEAGELATRPEWLKDIRILQRALYLPRKRVVRKECKARKVSDGVHASRCPVQKRKYDKARYERERDLRVQDARDYYWHGGGREKRRALWAARHRESRKSRRNYRLTENELLTIECLSGLGLSGNAIANLLGISRCCACRKIVKLKRGAVQCR